MMRVMSDDEVRAHDAEVRRLYASASREDQIVAILRDMKVGGTGETEATARAKAQAILKWLER